MEPSSSSAWVKATERSAALRRLPVRAELGAAEIREQIRVSLDPLLREVGASRGDLAAMGIGFGGPVDTLRSVVTVSNQIEGWQEFPLADWVRTELGVPHLALRNDAHAAALAEARWGAGVGFSPLLYVTIGSGVGGGLIVNGQIYGGAGAGAVEIGHVLVSDPHVPAGAGRSPVQELERVASGWSMGREAGLAVQRLRQAGASAGALASVGTEATTALLVAQAARQGDAVALAVVSRATQAMAHGLATAVTLLAPRRIILGGGVSLMGDDLWFTPIRRQLQDLCFAPFRDTFDVVPAELGEDVVVHGALGLARDRWLTIP